MELSAHQRYNGSKKQHSNDQFGMNTCKKFVVICSQLVGKPLDVTVHHGPAQQQQQRAQTS